MLRFVKIPLKSLFLTIISILFHLSVIKFHSIILVYFPYLKKKGKKTIVIYINTNKSHTLGDILDNNSSF